MYKIQIIIKKKSREKHTSLFGLMQLKNELFWQQLQFHATLLNKLHQMHPVRMLYSVNQVK